MSVAKLRNAFNEVALPLATCVKSRLYYERANDIEMQRLEFDGHFVADSEPFAIRSDLIRPNGDLIAASRATAERLLKRASKDGNTQSGGSAGDGAERP